MGLLGQWEPQELTTDGKSILVLWRYSIYRGPSGNSSWSVPLGGPYCAYLNHKKAQLAKDSHREAPSRGLQLANPTEHSGEPSHAYYSPLGGLC